MTPEGKLTRKIKLHLKKKKVWHLKVHGGPMQMAGVPDLLLCVKGKFVALELKAPGKKVTRLQQHQMERIKDSGGLAYVIDDFDIFLDTLHELGIE